MDDILLTREGIKTESGRCFRAWDAGRSGLPWSSPEAERDAYTLFWNDWLCRAQVQKMMEWLERHNEANTSQFFQGHLIVNDDDWQALRAAGVRS